MNTDDEVCFGLDRSGRCNRCACRDEASLGVFAWMLAAFVFCAGCAVGIMVGK